jgi:hypothetical protein
LNRANPTLFGLAAASLLFAGTTARADLIPWTYNWTPSVSAVFSDSPGTGKITLTNEPSGTATGTTDIVATNLKVFSTADPGTPDHFTNAKYALALTLTDSQSSKSGTLTFDGEFNGTISAKSSDITNAFTNTVVQSITLGQHLYRVSIGPFTPPAPPGATNSGTISGTAFVTVSNGGGGGSGGTGGATGGGTGGGTGGTGGSGGNPSPEPSTMVMAGLGLSILGLMSWRKRRSLKGGACRLM